MKYLIGLFVLSLSVSSFSAENLTKTRCGTASNILKVCLAKNDAGKDFLIITRTVRTANPPKSETIVPVKMKDNSRGLGSSKKTYKGSKSGSKYELTVSRVVYPNAPYEASLTINSDYYEFELKNVTTK